MIVMHFAKFVFVLYLKNPWLDSEASLSFQNFLRKLLKYMYIVGCSKCQPFVKGTSIIAKTLFHP